MKFLPLFFLLIAACGNTQVTPVDVSDVSDTSKTDTDKKTDMSETFSDVRLSTDTGSDTDQILDSGTDTSVSDGTCTHTTQGGVYASQACSESFQCCEGVWKDRAAGCGTCLCVEPTGSLGCTEKVDAPDYPHIGLTLEGSEIPRDGLQNSTGSVGTEQYGTVVTVDGREWVRGTVSHFGGPNDTGVTPSETGAITGENLRALNNPLDPSDAFLRENADAYYYIAMRWSYSPGGRSFWKDARIILRNNGNGKVVVVRPVDWGPHIRTARILDISPQALDDLGAQTDEDIDVAFAPSSTPLGPYVE